MNGCMSRAFNLRKNILSYCPGSWSRNSCGAGNGPSSTSCTAGRLSGTFLRLRLLLCWAAIPYTSWGRHSTLLENRRVWLMTWRSICMLRTVNNSERSSLSTFKSKNSKGLYRGPSFGSSSSASQHYCPFTHTYQDTGSQDRLTKPVRNTLSELSLRWRKIRMYEIT